MSKAMGVLGGYVAGSQALRELLIQRARPFLFSTSHPPADRRRLPRGDPGHGGGALADRAAVGEHAALQGRADAARASTPAARRRRSRRSSSGDSEAAIRFSGRLFEEGVFATSVVFPTVALDQARLRTIVTAALTDEHLDRALEAFARVGRSSASSRGERSNCRAPDDGARGASDQPRDLPLDAHLHTDQSPDSAVPIDVYAALAVERGIAEIAITDHVDFDPRDPAFEYSRYDDRERVVRGAAERWAKQGVAIRFGAELTYNRRWEADVRAHLAALSLRLRDRLGPRLARVAVLAVARSRLDRGPLARRDRGAVLRGDHRGGPVGAVRHDRPSRRREALPPPVRHRRRPRRRGRSSRSRRSGDHRERGGARGQQQRIAVPGRRDVSFGGRRGAVSRAGGRAGGGRVRRPLTWLIRRAARRRRTGTSTAAGFEALTFRRGAERVRIEVPRGTANGTADALRT